MRSLVFGLLCVNTFRRLESDLNDPRMGRQVLSSLLSNPVVEVIEIEGVVVKYRRYRLYVRGIGFRLLYVVYLDICRVWFDIAEKRDEETYKRFKRRLEARRKR